MRPILATIPPLPTAWWLPLSVFVLLLGAAYSWRYRNLSGLVTAIAAAGIGFVWTKHDVPLHSYGLFLVLGFFASTWLACLEAKRRGYDPNVVLDAAMPLLLISLVLCRTLYFLVYPSQWRGFGEFVQIWNGGLSFHGAIVGGLGTLAYFSWTRKIPFGTMTDFVAPGAFLGYAIGRIGCFMNGCCYGYAVDRSRVPWACRFPSEENRNILTPWCHPAQLYSTFMGLIIFSFLWKNRTNPRFNRYSGQLTLFFLGFYAVERAIMEYYRTGATAPMAFDSTWLTRAQLASILGLIVIGFAHFGLLRKARQQPSAPPLPTGTPTHVSAG